ncbi:hypothetical protein DFP72DRAFT_1010370 [Ephemerocybe angulata]|uniref:BRCT domain-containing protein n=1 Tax=Ephemerocybe angulata TaxID=980116 RepID=A0A8H6M449_9AGAR|nr:hypothetical protein DFP72DRAFT_1010370 [Tulosesus angulatus]
MATATDVRFIPPLQHTLILTNTPQLPAQDLEVLSAGILALGGQWRTGLTREITHLFTLSPTGPKYTTALHHQPSTNIAIVLPHWFDDAVRLGLGSLPTKPYEFPDPPVLKNPALQAPLSPSTAKAEKEKKAIGETDEVKRSVYETAVRSELQVQPAPGAREVWGGRRILLARNLMLFGGRRDAVAVGIQRAGGVVRLEAAAIPSCDIYITRYRSGPAYTRAFRGGKTIGTLAWLYHVQATGVVSRPMDQLLHYPVPERRVEGFGGHVGVFFLSFSFVLAFSFVYSFSFSFCSQNGRSAIFHRCFILRPPPLLAPTRSRTIGPLHVEAGGRTLLTTDRYATECYNNESDRNDLPVYVSSPLPNV